MTLRDRPPNPLTRPERRVAYVVTHYPQLTHTFIVDEMEALMARGVEVLPVAMNFPLPTEITGEHEARERDRTFYLKAQRPGRVLRTLWGASWTSPVGLVRVLMLAIGTAGFDLKLAVWRVFHVVEAILAWDHCRRHGVSHLHAQFGLAPATIAWFACEFGNRAGGRWTWSFTIHGFHDFVNERETALRPKAASASYVVCVSSFTRSQLMRLSAPEMWEKFHVIRCGIDLDRFVFAPRRELAKVPVIVLVGRLSPEKGHAVLLEALSRLRRDGLDAILEFVGPGEIGPDLLARADRLGVSDSVRLLGGLHSSQIPARLREGDVFCLPSFAEGLPVSIMEAMAVGIPVVTTFIGGIPELAVDEETALVVPAGDADSLARALARILRDDDLRWRLVHNARRRVEAHHSLDTNVQRLEALLLSRGAPISAP